MKWKFGNIGSLNLWDFEILQPINQETLNPRNQKPRNHETKNPPQHTDSHPYTWPLLSVTQGRFHEMRSNYHHSDPRRTRTRRSAPVDLVCPMHWLAGRQRSRTYVIAKTNRLTINWPAQRPHTLKVARTIEPSRQNLIIPARSEQIGPLLGSIGSLGAMVPGGQAEKQPENLISTHLAQ